MVVWRVEREADWMEIMGCGWAGVGAEVDLYVEGHLGRGRGE